MSFHLFSSILFAKYFLNGFHLLWVIAVTFYRLLVWSKLSPLQQSFTSRVQIIHFEPNFLNFFFSLPKKTTTTKHRSTIIQVAVITCRKKRGCFINVI